MCASYSAAAESGRMGMPGWKTPAAYKKHFHAKK